MCMCDGGTNFLGGGEARFALSQKEFDTMRGLSQNKSQREIF